MIEYYYQSKYSFYDRTSESAKIMQKFPERIPIICEKNIYSKNAPDIDKKKYLVPQDLTVGQFMHVIRKRINMDASQALFIFINGNIPTNSELLATCYDKYRNLDGFLYIIYDVENIFG
jgi:GABA(A) receptor-associated protein